jgi:hypothetical protein
MEIASAKAAPSRLWRAHAESWVGWEMAAWAVIALGAVVRIAEWLDASSLWVDEASLALNITDHSFVGLLGDLDFLQAAPVGFLLAEKLVGTVLGYGEDALRFLPLAAGLASLLVFSRLSRHFARGAGRVTALLLFALSPPLVRYSAELKQYSLDVLATVVILLVALAYRRRPLDARALAGLSLVGGVAVWFSQASVFALAGAFGALALEAALGRDTTRLRRLLVPGVIWGIAFAASYLVSKPNVDRIKASPDGTYTLDFDGVTWYARTVEHLGVLLFDIEGDRISVGYGVVAVAGLLAIAGVYRLVRDDWFKAALVLLPVAAAMAAATLHMYPLSGRFALFALPLTALLVGSGVTYVWSRVAASTSGRTVAGIATAVVALFVLVQAPSLLSRQKTEDVLPVLEYVRANWRSGDVLYVHEGSEDATAYNALVHGVNVRDGRTIWPAVRGPAVNGIVMQSLASRPPKIVVGRLSDDRRLALSEDLPRLAGDRRVWFVFSHVERYENNRFVDELPANVELLDKAGTRLDEFHRAGAVAYLYRLSRND